MRIWGEVRTLTSNNNIKALSFGHVAATLLVEFVAAGTDLTLLFVNVAAPLVHDVVH